MLYEAVKNEEKLEGWISVRNELFTHHICWYDFKKTERILVCGEYDARVINYLGFKFNRVECVETIIEVSMEESYNYVIFYANSSGEKNIDIEKAIHLVGLEGSVLIFFKNIIGISNILKKDLNGISLSNLRIKANEIPGANIKCYALLPDLEATSMIWNTETPLKKELVRRYYYMHEKGDSTFRDEIGLFKSMDGVSDQGIFNYYLMEVSLSDIKDTFSEAYFCNTRVEKYQLMTRRRGDFYIKTAVSEEANDHLNNVKNNVEMLKCAHVHCLDTVIGDSIVSQLSKGKKLSAYFENLKFEELINWINRYLYLFEEFEAVEFDEAMELLKTQNIPVLTEVGTKELDYKRYLLWDLNFDNIFVENQELYAYDQEWCASGLPVEFALFYAIKNCETISHTVKEELYSYYDITPYISWFEQIAVELMKDNSNEIRTELFENGSNQNVLSERERVLNGKVEEQREKVEEQKNLTQNILRDRQRGKAELRAEVNNLSGTLDITRAQLVNYQHELEEIYNSESYRVLRILKKIFKPMKSVYKGFKRVCKKALKLLTRIVHPILKVVFKLFPRKIKRAIRQKAQLSRMSAQIMGIPWLGDNVQKSALYDYRTGVMEEVYHSTRINGSIAIHLHLFYTDLAEEFIQYFSNIPYVFDLYISIPEDEKTYVIQRKFKNVTNANKIVVKNAKNCGRDFGPMMVLFANDLKKYDYIMHVHSKKSLRVGTEQADWRRFLLNSLLGSAEKITNQFYMMENMHIGITFPEAYNWMPYWSTVVLDEMPLTKQIYRRMGLEFTDTYKLFSGGSMFWAKTEAVYPLLDLNLTWDDFGEENGQTGGHLEYVFERSWGDVCRQRGYDVAIFDDQKDYYLKNRQENIFAWCDSLNADRMYNTLLSFDGVSFDIFDTLVTRKVYCPDDAFVLMEKKILDEHLINSGYISKRKQAEAQVRKDKDYVGDCTIHEIYAKMQEMYGIDQTTANRMKQIEIDTEIQLCIPRRDMLKVFNGLKEANKKIILFSDMYMTSDILEEILKNCGYTGYSEIRVSSETGLRKDQGSAWDAYREEYIEHNYVHVGDSELSDCSRAADRGIAHCNVLSSKRLLDRSVYNDFRIQTYQDSILMGLVLNNGVFNSPFAADGIKKPIYSTLEEVGYTVIGPRLLRYFTFVIANVVDKDDIPYLIMPSREGYYIKQAYETLVENLTDAHVDWKEIKDIKYGYLLTSRRSLNMASLSSMDDQIQSLQHTLFDDASLAEFLYYNYGIVDTKMEYKAITLPRDAEIAAASIERHWDEIEKEAAEERLCYEEYLDGALPHNEEHLYLLDLGYSGSAQLYLNKMLERQVDGLYFAIQNLKPISKYGAEAKALYYSDRADEGIASCRSIYLISILLESFLCAPDGQLEKFIRDENAGVQPVYRNKTSNSQVANMEEVNRGTCRFIEDYLSIYRGKIQDIDYNIDSLGELYDVLTDDILLPSGICDHYEIEVDLITTGQGIMTYDELRKGNYVAK